MSKFAIVTRADLSVKSYTDTTFKSIKEYAKKCSADFVILSDPPPFLTDDKKPHYRILKLFKMFDEYDRILHLDADMIVNKNCENLFKIVHEDSIGSIYEDVGSRAYDRRGKILEMQKYWGDVGWREGYTNAGTFIMSKQHKNIFKPHNNMYWTAWGSADLHMSYNIHKYNFHVHELDFKWNHMTMFSEQWNNNADRFNSNIIHYAGKGIFDTRFSTKIEQIKNDHKLIYGEN
jgi:lipopolysaccharide biosynthesis glycosyltransferase